MPDYVVSVSKSKVVKTDYEVTAANESAAQEAAIRLAQQEALERSVGTYTFEATVQH